MAHLLDPLIIAALDEPGVGVAHRTDTAVQLALPDGSLLHFALATDREALTADLSAAQKQLPPGSTVVWIAAKQVDGAAETIKRLLPAVQLRSVQRGAVWSTGGLETVGGGSAPLRRIASRVSEAPAISLDEAIERRAAEQEQATAFFAQLSARRPFTVISIALVAGVGFGLQLLWGSGNAVFPAPRMGANLASLTWSEPWRLLAPMALHVNVVHLAMNLLALFSVGPFLERLLGWQRFSLVFVLSGVGGSVASSLRGEDLVAVGASGGVWGLMVGTAVLISMPGRALPGFVSASMLSRVWTPVALNAVYSLSPGIDLLAHLGGGLTGALVVVLARRGLGAPGEPRRPSGALTAAALGCLALALGSVGLASARGRPWELIGTPAMQTRALGRVSLQLPSSLEPTALESGWLCGRLLTDPIAVVVSAEGAPLSENQAANARDTMEASTESLPMAIDGFTFDGAPQITQLDEHRVLMTRTLRATDGRRALNSWLFLDRTVVNVLVFMARDAPAPWRAIGEAVATSTTLAGE